MPPPSSGRAGRFGKQRRLGARLENHQRLAEIDAAIRNRRERMQRLIEPHVLRHVQQRAARPAGRVERRKLIFVRIDDAALEERPQQVAVLAHQLAQPAEQHALLGPFRRELGSHRVAIHR